MKGPLLFNASMMLIALLTAGPLAAATQGVSFVSGGIGENSVTALKAREREFNLKLVFTLNEGNYLADVGVRITDAAGKLVIEHVTDGPIFMARLPAGAYTMQATYNGKAQTRKLSVGDRLQTAYLRWPSDPGRDVTLLPEGRETPGRSTA
ncbi:MAG: T9SS type A sorting domain-containing protein, partial [Betaproteobacteria bacterium]